MSRLIRAAAVAASIATVIGTAAAGPAAATQAARGGASPAVALHWKRAFRHQYNTDNPGSGFATVVAPGRDDAWAFGWKAPAMGGLVGGLAAAAHWNGHQWRTVSLGLGSAGGIAAASAVSRDDIWAAGQEDHDVLRWNGHAWSVVRHWPGNAGSDPRELSGITAISAADVWVFGRSGLAQGLGTWHYNGHAWKRFTGAASSSIISGSAVSAHDIWAIGATRPPYTGDVIVRYNGHRWLRASAPALREMRFNGITAVSRSSVWVAGMSFTGGARSVLMHWNGESWQRFTVPGGPMTSEIIVPAGNGGLWLLTSDSTDSYLLYRSVAGAWSRKALGPVDRTAVQGLARIPGTSSVLAAASSYQSGNPAAAIYQGSRG
ncbi:MAG TPA: hypothetical protein VGG25_06490 [Streptosporangiaceae bacterium]|jgi:hypothetical protein